MNIDYTSIKETFTNIEGWLLGAILSFLAHLAPLYETFITLFVFFCFDVFFGFLVAKKKRNERFSSKIVWSKTVPKMAIITLIIVLVFQLDSLAPTDFMKLTSLISWGLSGLILHSILQNILKLTDYKEVKEINDILTKKMKENEINTKD